MCCYTANCLALLCFLTCSQDQSAISQPQLPRVAEKSSWRLTQGIVRWRHRALSSHLRTLVWFSNPERNVQTCFEFLSGSASNYRGSNGWHHTRPYPVWAHISTVAGLDFIILWFSKYYKPHPEYCEEHQLVCNNVCKVLNQIYFARPQLFFLELTYYFSS